MQQMSKLIFRYLSRGTRMDEDAQAVCLYGIDIFLYTLISSIGLLLIGTLAHRFFRSSNLDYALLFKPNLWRRIPCHKSSEVFHNNGYFSCYLPAITYSCDSIVPTNSPLGCFEHVAIPVSFAFA